MTAGRQQRKPRLMLALVIGLAWIGILIPYANAYDVEFDSNTGLAISGFDPLSYFVEHKALMGKSEWELNRNGAIWQFRNPGNRAAFALDPQLYMPMFGGRDPVAITRGISVPGHPLVWAIVRQRLYLFYDEPARSAFLADPGRIIAAAERKWPAVARSLGQ